MTVSDIWRAYRALQAENAELKRKIEQLRAIKDSANDEGLCEPITPSQRRSADTGWIGQRPEAL